MPRRIQQQPAPTARARRRPAAQGHQPTETVAVQRKVGREVVEAGDAVTRRTPVKLKGEPAFVRVGGSVTRNLGDYNSIKVEVSLTMPCDPADIDATYEATASWVEDAIQAELGAALGQ